MDENSELVKTLEKQTAELRQILNHSFKPEQQESIYQLIEAMYLEVGIISKNLSVHQQVAKSNIDRMKSKETYLEAEIAKLIREQKMQKEDYEQEVTEKTYLKEEAAHLKALLDYRDNEIIKMQNHINGLSKWLNDLQNATAALLRSKRWKIGCYAGDIARRMLFRPRVALWADYIVEIFREYDLWREKKDSLE